jgi:precorrin-3B methylase
MKAVNANKNRQRGKRTERAIAKRLKAKRVGILSKSDVEHPLFSCEVKSRLKFVGEKWFMQAVRNCEKGKIPAVIVHITGKAHKNDYVILKLKDFEDLLGRIK